MEASGSFFVEHASCELDGPKSSTGDYPQVVFPIDFPNIENAVFKLENKLMAEIRAITS
jgi:hypothetical protein